MKFITPTLLLLLGVATAHPAIPEAVQEDIAALPKELDTRKNILPKWQFAELRFEEGLRESLVALNIAPARRDMLSKEIKNLTEELVHMLDAKCEAQHLLQGWPQRQPTIVKPSSLPATPASQDIAALPKKLDTRKINSAEHIPAAISSPHFRGPHSPILPNERMVLNEYRSAFDRSLAAVNISAEDSARLAHDFRLLSARLYFHQDRHALLNHAEAQPEAA